MDFEWGWQSPENIVVPNWRESQRCPACGLNGRQRMIVQLLRDYLATAAGDKTTVYMMEQLSPVFRWTRAAFPQASLIGSEYCGPEIARGTTHRGVRHEDAEHLSLADGSVSLLVSCDVFEHVNDPERCFREASRVLEPGGRVLLTFPMDPNLDRNVRRAAVRAGVVEHLLPAVYHGNPLSTDGSLVFTDFGWEVVEQLRRAGMPDATANVYWSYEYGYLGIQMYFSGSTPR